MVSSFSSSSFHQHTESLKLLKDPVEMMGIQLKLWHRPAERGFFSLIAQLPCFEIKGFCFLKADAEQLLTEVKSCMSWTFASSLLMGRKERKEQNLLSLFVSDKPSQEQQSMKAKISLKVQMLRSQGGAQWLCVSPPNPSQLPWGDGPHVWQLSHWQHQSGGDWREKLLAALIYHIP